MPLYVFGCEACKGISERLLAVYEDAPICCGVPMNKLPTTHAMVKMKGMGGYPSLRKAVKGGAQYYRKELEKERINEEKRGGRPIWV